jgi:hypothetical protein
LFSAHLEFVDDFLRKGRDISILNGEDRGLGRDELKELREGLVELVERYRAEEIPN